MTTEWTCPACLERVVLPITVRRHPPIRTAPPDVRTIVTLRMAGAVHRCPTQEDPTP